MATQLQVGGIACTAYNVPGPGTTAPVALLFFAHGRHGHAADKLTLLAVTTILAAARDAHSKHLIVVTLDQRNHGARMLAGGLPGGGGLDRNRGWKDNFKAIPTTKLPHEFDNPTHAVDMYSIQVGTTRDISFLIDFLPAVLFPNDEHIISDWFVSGISLGGHVSWLALANDPRISLAVPIIGSASFLTLMTHRASTLAPPLGPLPVAAPHFPASLLAKVSQFDAVNFPLSHFKGRHILALSGEDDTLVNFGQSGTEEFMGRLAREGVDASFLVFKGVGHTCTEAMAKAAGKFVAEKGLQLDIVNSKI